MDDYEIVMQLREQLAKEKELNKNLKRICRERANSARKLYPKKEHNGYLVLSSSQYTQKYTIEVEHAQWRREHPTTNVKEYRRFVPKEAIVWKTTIQTYYDASIPIKTIEMQIWQELSPIFRSMGIVKRSAESANGVFCKFKMNFSEEVCGIYKWAFRANFKAGFWELDIYTTDSIKIEGSQK